MENYCALQLVAFCLGLLVPILILNKFIEWCN